MTDKEMELRIEQLTTRADDQDTKIAKLMTSKAHHADSDESSDAADVIEHNLNLGLLQRPS